jgi:hypothetical protein
VGKNSFFLLPAELCCSSFTIAWGRRFWKRFLKSEKPNKKLMDPKYHGCRQVAGLFSGLSDGIA